MSEYVFVGQGKVEIGIFFIDVMCQVLIPQHFECLEHHRIPNFSTIDLWLHLENQMVLRGNIFWRQFLELQLISGKDIAVVCGPFIAILKTTSSTLQSPGVIRT